MVQSSLCHIGCVSILSSLGKEVQCGRRYIMCYAQPLPCFPLLTFPGVLCVNVQRLGSNIGRALLHPSCSHPPSWHGPLQDSGILVTCVLHSSFCLCIVVYSGAKILCTVHLHSDYIFVKYTYPEITYSYTIHFRVY